MTDNEKFKYIKLTPPDDDEVIVVGEVARPPEPHDAPDPHDAPEPVDPHDLTDAPEPRDASHGSKPTANRKPSEKKDSYQETTLDDLKSEGAPFAQKIVIIAAIALIIVAIVYYVAFMG